MISWANLAGRLCTYPAESGLEVGRRIRSAARVVVLLEVRLEGRGAVGVLRLVTKSSAGVEVQVVVVGGDLVLALLHAPEHKCDATKKQSTADTADYSTDNALVGTAQAATVIAALLRRWWVCESGLAGSDESCAGACRSQFDLRAIADGRNHSHEFLDRRSNEGTGPHDGGRSGRRGNDWRLAGCGGGVRAALLCGLVASACTRCWRWCLCGGRGSVGRLWLWGWLVGCGDGGRGIRCRRSL